MSVASMSPVGVQRAMTSSQSNEKPVVSRRWRPGRASHGGDDVLAGRAWGEARRPGHLLVGRLEFVGLAGSRTSDHWCRAASQRNKPLLVAAYASPNWSKAMRKMVRGPIGLAGPPTRCQDRPSLDVVQMPSPRRNPATVGLAGAEPQRAAHRVDREGASGHVGEVVGDRGPVRALVKGAPHAAVRRAGEPGAVPRGRQRRDPAADNGEASTDVRPERVGVVQPAGRCTPGW